MPFATFLKLFLVPIDEDLISLLAPTGFNINYIEDKAEDCVLIVGLNSAGGIDDVIIQ